jgi:hypothetical protein
MVKLCKEE